MFAFQIELLDVTDDQRERLLKGILEIQKYFRGHQARCYYTELKRGTVALQSCNAYILMVNILGITVFYLISFCFWYK